MISTRHILAAALATALTGFGLAGAEAAEAIVPPGQSWSFSGPFGTFDRAQLQRGLNVYHQVCKGCHGLTQVSFRNLAEPGGPGLSVAQATAFAKEYKVKDGPNEQGEMFEREARPADRFPQPWANENAARQLYNGAVPPDLSLMAKARTYERGFPWFLIDIVTQYQEQGPDYIVALLKGYEDPPQGFQLPEGSNYNKYFPGHAIAMPPPLSDGLVKYPDGSPETVDQYAKDVAAFMAWTAEPHMEARKRVGLQVMIFLIVFAGLLYFTKKKVWADIHGHA